MEIKLRVQSVKSRSEPQLLLESARVAAAWLTTGTVYLRKTVICGHLNLELDSSQEEKKKLQWKWNKRHHVPKERPGTTYHGGQNPRDDGSETETRTTRRRKK